AGQAGSLLLTIVTPALSRTEAPGPNSPPPSRHATSTSPASTGENLKRIEPPGVVVSQGKEPTSARGASVGRPLRTGLSCRGGGRSPAPPTSIHGVNHDDQ